MPVQQGAAGVRTVSVRVGESTAGGRVRVHEPTLRIEYGNTLSQGLQHRANERVHRHPLPPVNAKCFIAGGDVVRDAPAGPAPSVAIRSVAGGCRRASCPRSPGVSPGGQRTVSFDRRTADPRGAAASLVLLSAPYARPPLRAQPRTRAAPGRRTGEPNREGRRAGSGPPPESAPPGPATGRDPRTRPSYRPHEAAPRYSRRAVRGR